MPLPPPPAADLIINGNPIFDAIVTISSSLRIPSPSVPGTTGTPAFCIMLRATILSPIAAIALGVGPTKINPASIQA